MHELIPVAAGAIVGALVSQLRTTWVKVVVFVAMCLLVGFAMSFLTGELEVSAGFLSVDAGLVWLGGLIAVALAEGWRRYSARPRAA
ncbi:hypothetical protein K2Z83_25425 [Oscillochloris sp. ZM17-4]|uniref:hypothetical protein n=1 Tax=Oscillochloris sp. ZM17-4 TaxID=2866714 RepID=UPI001C735C37|nr:hypothetical protein [Oscillochloris sp. ZM17-4]MBX0331000.1 hypothetical protein [Oscillochloris sp. ZM17-4]